MIVIQYPKKGYHKCIEKEVGKKSVKRLSPLKLNNIS